jgi:replicative DNA helicase
LSNHAWGVDNKKVLFATTEMSKIRIAMRFAALFAGVPYDHVRKGQISDLVEPEFRKKLESVMSDTRLNVVGGEFNFTIEGLEGAIEEAQPDLLIMDGAYLLKSAGTNRIERAANAFDDLKRLAIHANIPCVVTTQFNREVKNNTPGSVKQESIALTDVAAWNADLIFGLVQTDDMRKDHRMIFKPLKTREGVSDEFETVWNFELMQFNELPKASTGGDPDAFGTGLSGDGTGGDGAQSGFNF